MPNMVCDCGNLIRMGEIPNPNEWLFISDVEYDKYTGNIDSEELYREMKRFVLCSQCSRLIVYWNGFNNSPVIYAIDNVIPTT